jgi:hypothetical protein
VLQPYNDHRVVHVHLALRRMPVGIVVYLNQRSNYYHHHHPLRQMAVLTDLKLTAHLRHRLLLTVTLVALLVLLLAQGAMRIQIAMVVVAAEEHKIQRVMMEVAVIRVVKTRINNMEWTPKSHSTPRLPWYYKHYFVCVLVIFSLLTLLKYYWILYV